MIVFIRLLDGVLHNFDAAYGIDPAFTEFQFVRFSIRSNQHEASVGKIFYNKHTSTVSQQSDIVNNQSYSKMLVLL